MHLIGLHHRRHNAHRHRTVGGGPDPALVVTSSTPRPLSVPETAVALLWDLDNVSVPTNDVPSLAQALADLVPPGAPRVVAAHWRAYRTHRDTLSQRGWRVLCGSRLPKGTDEVLLRQAKRLRRKCGVSRFVLASNDHDFMRIAALGELHVVTLNAACLSTRLRNRACSVTVLHPERVSMPDVTDCDNDVLWSAVTVPRRAVARDGFGDLTTEC